MFVRLHANRFAAGAALVLGAVVALPFSGHAAPGTPWQRLSCNQRAETSSPTVFNDPHDRGRVTTVHLGPLELHGGRGYASPRAFSLLGVSSDGFVHAKVALVVAARHSLWVQVGGSGSRSVLLAYRVGEAPSSVLRIASCPANTPARTRAGVVGSGTVFTGVFELTAAQCVRVQVTDIASTRRWRASLPLGRSCVS